MATAFSYNPDHHLHTSAGHPEHDGRLASVLSLLERRVIDELIPVASGPVPLDTLAMVHPEEYIEGVRSLADAGGGMADQDTYVTPASFEVAREASGALLHVLDAVFSGQAENGFAAVRPPGHHASASRAMGFCLFNNVAVAARLAQRQFDIRRILIVDFDVHHGNGTQDIFYNDGDVLFISTHQHPLYPGTGMLEESGAGQGKGKTINVPLPAACGDGAYAQVFDQILEPAATRFKPELILVSAGYDAHWRDPLAGMNLSVSGYAALMRRIHGWAGSLCNGRLVAVLEGGYDLEALPFCVLASLQALNGAPVEDPFPVPEWPEPAIQPLITAVRKHHGL